MTLANSWSHVAGDFLSRWSLAAAHRQFGQRSLGRRVGDSGKSRLMTWANKDARVHTRVHAAMHKCRTLAKLEGNALQRPIISLGFTS